MPSEVRRIEAGIFDCGSDMTLADDPLQLAGMERLVGRDDHGRDISRAVLRPSRRSFHDGGDGSTDAQVVGYLPCCLFGRRPPDPGRFGDGGRNGNPFPPAT